MDSGTLAPILVGPTGDKPPEGKLAYDLFIWDWVGDNGDPNTLLQDFLCSAIGSLSDSQYCNPKYDELYKQQNEVPNEEARKAPMAELQQLVYDEAPYQILVNRANLQAYRTDKFAGWKVMPTGTGTPLFVMGNINYTLLEDAKATPSPSPTPTPAPSAAPTSAPSVAPSGAATAAPPSAAPTAAPSPSPAPGGGGTGGDNSLLLVGGVIALIVILASGLVIVRRGRAGGPGAEEE
jgi:hypothetical protein